MSLVVAVAKPLSQFNEKLLAVGNVLRSFREECENSMRVLRACKNTKVRRSYIGTNTHNYRQLTRTKMVSSNLGNRDAGQRPICSC